MNGEGGTEAGRLCSNEAVHIVLWSDYNRQSNIVRIFLSIFTGALKTLSLKEL